MNWDHEVTLTIERDGEPIDLVLRGCVASNDDVTIVAMLLDDGTGPGTDAVRPGAAFAGELTPAERVHAEERIYEKSRETRRYDGRSEEWEDARDYAAGLL